MSFGKQFLLFVPASPTPRGRERCPVSPTLRGGERCPASPTFRGGERCPASPTLRGSQRCPAAPTLRAGERCPAAPTLRGGERCVCRFFFFLVLHQGDILNSILFMCFRAESSSRESLNSILFLSFSAVPAHLPSCRGLPDPRRGAPGCRSVGASRARPSVADSPTGTCLSVCLVCVFLGLLVCLRLC